MKSTIDTLTHNLNQCIPLPFDTPHKIALAVSGGVDSICLALLSKQWQEKIYEETNTEHSLTCLIVDHGIRPESYDEANQVANRLKGLGLNVEILRYTAAKITSNIQEKARIVRYGLMLDYCRNNGINYLLTAHNKNDQAETVIQRMLRGSGVTGLSGIAKVREHLYDVRIIRPMLDIPRHEIEEVVQSADVPYIQDPSNNDPKFLRTKCRNFISQNGFMEPNLLVNRLSLVASNMARAEDYIESEVDRAYGEMIHVDEFHRSKISREAFMTLHEEIALRLLKRVLTTMGDELFRGEHALNNLEQALKYDGVRLKSLLNLWKKLKLERTFGTTLCGNEVTANDSSIEITRELSYCHITVNFHDGKSDSCTWDNRFIMEDSGMGSHDVYYVSALGVDGWNSMKKSLKSFCKENGIGKLRQG